MSETDAPATTESTRKGPWPLIVVVAAITLILILLVPSEDEPEPTKPAPSSNEGTPPAPSLLTDGKSQAEPQAAPQTQATLAAPVDLPPGAAARKLIAELRQQSPLDLERIVSEAAKQQRQGRLEDAYLLYFFAAREGHAGAAMTLAQQADPASFKPGGLFDQADELQSNKWYQVAAQAGQSEAASALQTLRSRVEQAAAAGDERAQRIMLQWK